MTDRELLEAAAKAVGIRLEWDGPPDKWQPMYYQGKTYHSFDPLTDDGDALRLAVTCGLVVDCSRPSAGEPWKQHAIWLDETMSNAELTRRAIVRAAAEIGRGMK